MLTADQITARITELTATRRRLLAEHETRLTAWWVDFRAANTEEAKLALLGEPQRAINALQTEALEIDGRLRKLRKMQKQAVRA